MSIGRSLRDDPLILPFYLPSLILSVSWGLLTPVLPLYAKELNASYALVGLVLAGEAIGMLLGDVPAGVLMRRFGQKETMLIGSALAALATAALFLAGGVPAAVVLRIIAGFGRALFTVSRHAYVAGVASVGRRGRAIALFGGLMRIGSFLGPLAGGVIAAGQGLRSIFLVFGAANLAALAAMAVFVRAASEERAASGLGGHGALLVAALKERYRVLIASGGGQLLAQMIRAGRPAIIPLYAADVLGLDVTAIGAIVSLGSAVDMSLFYPAGWIMDRLGRKYAIVPSFLIQAVGMCLVPFTGTFWGLLAAEMVIGFGNGLGAGCMMTLGADLAPKHARGEFLGIWRLIGDVGHMGGPMLVGQVADLVTLPTAAWAIAGAGLGAALVFWRLVPEPLKAHAQASQAASTEG
ncbi:MAG: MFS transporter [Anaerolineae bacterium]|nr:MFS transporter [Anaerolineae bacterium]